MVNIKSYHEKPQEKEETIYLKLVEEKNSIMIKTFDEKGEETNSPYLGRIDFQNREIKVTQSNILFIKYGFNLITD